MKMNKELSLQDLLAAFIYVEDMKRQFKAKFNDYYADLEENEINEKGFEYFNVLSGKLSTKIDKILSNVE